MSKNTPEIKWRAVRIADDVYKRAAQVALDTDDYIGNVLTAILREGLAKRSQKKGRATNGNGQHEGRETQGS